MSREGQRPGGPQRQPSQVDKFRELARELGCDESEERFDAALRCVGKVHLQKDEHTDTHKDKDDAKRRVARPTKR